MRPREQVCQVSQAGKSIVAEVDPDYASSAFGERAEVAEGLGLFQDAKRVWFAGNGKICFVIRDDLKEHSRVRTTFVKLSG